MVNYKINDDLVSENAKQMKADILSLMKETDQLVLDFTNANYIDSIGLGMLVSIYKESITRKINIRMINCNDNIKKLFRITALDDLFLNV